MQKMSYKLLLVTFRKIGYNVDTQDLNITVLREKEFPFRRLTLPNKSFVSKELVEVYLSDLRINQDDFFNVYEETFKRIADGTANGKYRK